MYETLWVRLLGFTFGTTTLATSLVLAAFFGGLGLGGWLAGRRLARLSRPLRWYAGIELLIWASALGTLFTLQALTPLYVALYRSPIGHNLALISGLQLALSFVCILVPAALMGATLPLIARCYVASARGFGADLGLLYAVNTLGGALGLVAMGFVLIELLGLRASYLLTGGLNLLAALLALSSERGRWTESAPELAERAAPAPAAPAPAAASLPAGWVYGLTFSFGFVSIGLQVLWVRLWSFISLHSGSIRVGHAPAEFSSTYVFSGIVLLCLIGIAAGGWLVDRLLGQPGRALRVLALVQLLQGSWVLLTVQAERQLAFDSLWVKLAEVAAIALPSTLLMGLTFPLLAHVHVQRRSDLGARFGAYYAFNAVGCALGSLCAALLLLPALGTYRAISVLGLVSLGLGALLLVSRPVGLPALGRRRATLYGLGIAAVLGLSVVGAARPHQASFGGEVMFEEDNEVAHTLVVRRGRNRHLIMNNNAQAGTTDYESGFGARTVGIPIALRGEPPRKILLIAVGVGNSWIASQRYDAEVTAVDINPAVFRAMPAMHPPEYVEPLSDPKNRPIVADGRNFLLLTDEKYDLINIDPGPPITQPGMVNLHTREFFELASQRLTPRGVLYMRLAQTLDNEVFYRMLVRAIADVFPEVTLWTFDNGVDVIAANWKFETVTRRDDLIDGDVFGEMDDWFLIGRPQVDEYVAGYPPITDDQPRLEYYLLSRLRGVWPNGTRYLVNVKENRDHLIEHDVPMQSYLREVLLD